jgi:hypothetical protein
MLIASLFLIAHIGAGLQSSALTQVECVTPPYDPLRVRRLPGVAATTSKPRNPLEDVYPPCISAMDDLIRRAKPSARNPERHSPFRH